MWVIYCFRHGDEGVGAPGDGGLAAGLTKHTNLSRRLGPGGARSFKDALTLRKERWAVLFFFSNK